MTYVQWIDTRDSTGKDDSVLSSFCSSYFFPWTSDNKKELFDAFVWLFAGKIERIWCDEMGSEADTETTAANAVDSDGSVSWEDFFGKLIRYNVFTLCF